MKNFLCILLIAAACLITGCSSARERGQLIQSGKYFSVSEGTPPSEVHYKIYDEAGNMVLSESTDRPLSITMADESTVDISEGMGSGLTRHVYYDTENNLFSDAFYYVVCTSDDLVAYIGSSQNDSSQNTTLIVRDIFEKEDFYKEFHPDFSETSLYDLSAVEGAFSKDQSSLNITYASEERQTSVSQSFELK